MNLEITSVLGMKMDRLNKLDIRGGTWIFLRKVSVGTRGRGDLIWARWWWGGVYGVARRGKQ